MILKHSVCFGLTAGVKLWPYKAPDMSDASLIIVRLHISTVL